MCQQESLGDGRQTGAERDQAIIGGTNPGGHSVSSDHHSDKFRIGAIGYVLRLDIIDGSFVESI
jgi:hypothetical protein